MTELPNGGGSGLTPEDLAYLEESRILARLGWGWVHPNPMVGCVLVRDGNVVGRGYHALFGGPHAEVVALRAAGERASGATAYVSLEPCDHHGKTPPCSRALASAGVRRVVYGAADPSALASGGARSLREAGVHVDGPAWSVTEGRAENPAFFHLAGSGESGATGKRPYVALKIAMSLDSRIAAGVGETTRVTGPEAHAEVHELRKGFDGILVGAQTARTDDPRLTVRLAEPGRVPPARLVLDSEARLPGDGRLFESEGGDVHVFTAQDAPASDRKRLERAGARVHAVPRGGGGLDLAAVLEACWAADVQSILCEGGGRLAVSLLEADFVQRLYLLLAPRTLGESGVPAFPDATSGIPAPGFRPVGGARALGHDALVVFDREETH